MNDRPAWYARWIEEPFTMAPESIEYIRTRPECLHRAMIAYPPFSVVRLKEEAPVSVCRAHGGSRFLVVVGWLEGDVGGLCVTNKPYGSQVAHIEERWIEFIGCRAGVSHDLIRSLLDDPLPEAA